MAKFCRTSNGNFCPNISNIHKDAALLDAEWAVLKKKKGDLRLKFEQAIVIAGRRGLTHLQALANERLAMYMEEVGDKVESFYRYEQAIKLYDEWGATAKIEQLQPKIDAMTEHAKGLRYIL
jgi:hypothetical protein